MEDNDELLEEDDDVVYEVEEEDVQLVPINSLINFGKQYDLDEIEALIPQCEDEVITMGLQLYVDKQNKRKSRFRAVSGRALLELVTDEILRHDSRTLDGAGRRKGIGGDNSILFAEHLKKRHRREVTSDKPIDPAYTVNSNGQPGMYNRQAPDGRKVNSEEQRRRHGASYFGN